MPFATQSTAPEGARPMARKPASTGAAGGVAAMGAVGGVAATGEGGGTAVEIEGLAGRALCVSDCGREGRDGRDVDDSYPVIKHDTSAPRAGVTKAGAMADCAASSTTSVCGSVADCAGASGRDGAELVDMDDEDCEHEDDDEDDDTSELATSNALNHLKAAPHINNGLFVVGETDSGGKPLSIRVAALRKAWKLSAPYAFSERRGMEA